MIWVKAARKDFTLVNIIDTEPILIKLFLVMSLNTDSIFYVPWGSRHHGSPNSFSLSVNSHDILGKIVEWFHFEF